jgi:protein ImuA
MQEQNKNIMRAPAPSSLSDLKARGWLAPALAPVPQPAAFPFGLGVSGVHEIVEVVFGDLAASTGFAMAAAPQTPQSVVWIRERTRTLEHGLAAARLHAGVRLDVAARGNDEALWAVEEAVTSAAAALVVAELSQADFTATRRISLASQRSGTPVILLLPWQTQGASASSVRWRVKPRASGVNRFDPRAPGPARWRVMLERCRPAPALAGNAFDIEHSDETLSFTLVAALAAADTGTPPRRALTR